MGELIVDIPGIPRIPTDNLYKFMALSGVLRFVVGFAVLGYGMIRVTTSWHPVIAEARLRGARWQAALDQKNRSNAMIRSGGNRSRADALWDSATALQDSLKQTESLFKGREEERKDERDLLNIFVPAGIAVGVIGVVVAVTGFGLWYARLQKPLDAIVRRQAEQELSHSNASSEEH